MNLNQSQQSCWFILLSKMVSEKDIFKIYLTRYLNGIWLSNWNYFANICSLYLHVYFHSHWINTKSVEQCFLHILISISELNIVIYFVYIGWHEWKELTLYGIKTYNYDRNSNIYRGIKNVCLKNIFLQWQYVNSYCELSILRWIENKSHFLLRLEMIEVVMQCYFFYI